MPFNSVEFLILEEYIDYSVQGKKSENEIKKNSSIAFFSRINACHKIPQYGKTGADLKFSGGTGDCSKQFL